jgi:hypothetical protein
MREGKEENKVQIQETWLDSVFSFVNRNVRPFFQGLTG